MKRLIFFSLILIAALEFTDNIKEKVFTKVYDSVSYGSNYRSTGVTGFQ